jgi:hypothetical protein
MPGLPVDLGVSIADAEDVRFAYDGDALLLTFTDWRKRRLRVAFRERSRCGGSVPRTSGGDEAYDGPNVVADSPWLDRHRRQSEATSAHRHLKLNFNAAGCLEVICTGIDVPGRAR